MVLLITIAKHLKPEFCPTLILVLISANFAKEKEGKNYDTTIDSYIASNNINDYRSILFGQKKKD